MASFFDRLFRRHGRPSEAASPVLIEPVRVPNPVAIPVPDGMPAELLVRVPTRQPRDPNRKRKRRTPEEKAADHKAWSEGMVQQNRVRFDFDRGRAEAIGLTHYRWRSAGDGDACKVCRSRNGKQFPLRAVNNFLHPGFMLCVCDPDDENDEASSQPCRC